MKKIIFFPSSCGTDKENEFESCRGEGRYIINMAFGFSLIGYECYIINSWKLTTPKKIWNNVYISNQPDENIIYEFAISFDNEILVSQKNYKNKIVMSYAHLERLIEYNKKNNLDITLEYPCNISTDNLIASKNTQFFPTIFPIPSISTSFIPFKYEPNLPELKIYIIDSTWDRSFGSNYCQQKQLLVLRFLKTKGHKLNLSVQVENEEFIKDGSFPYTKYFNNDKIQYIDNRKVRYDDIIKLIRESDLCMTTGTGYDRVGSCMLDMISLGKPVIYIVNGGPRKELTLNPLYNCPENLIITQESDEDSNKKLEKIFNNLELYYNCFKNQLSCYDFRNWKNSARRILNIQSNSLVTKEIRSKYANKIRNLLKIKTGLDFTKVSSQCTMVETEEPILYEFSNLILNKYNNINNNINNVVEFGCGMSTIWFTYLSTLKNINFISFEDDEKWMNECIKLIKKCIDYDNPNIHHVNLETKKLPISFEKADLIFVDGLRRIGSLYDNIDIISDNTIIIADDMAGDFVQSLYDGALAELGKKLGYKEICFFWSRDRVIAILDKKNRFNKDEQLYWSIEL